MTPRPSRCVDPMIQPRGPACRRQRPAICSHDGDSIGLMSGYLGTCDDAIWNTIFSYLIRFTYIARRMSQGIQRRTIELCNIRGPLVREPPLTPPYTVIQCILSRISIVLLSSATKSSETRVATMRACVKMQNGTTKFLGAARVCDAYIETPRATSETTLAPPPKKDKTAKISRVQ